MRLGRALLVAAAVGLLATLNVSPAEEPPAVEAKAETEGRAATEAKTPLEGKWKVAAVLQNGQPVPSLAVGQWVFSGDELMIDRGDKKDRARFTIKPDSKPTSISIQPLDRDGKPLPSKIEGSYELTPDSLKLNITPPNGPVRTIDLVKTVRIKRGAAKGALQGRQE